MKKNLDLNQDHLEQLQQSIQGTLHWDALSKAIYATDASVYRKTPTAVAYPKNVEDIKTIIDFAREHQIGLIPRTAGTSLAGQCVGTGIVVDVSKHFTEILELDVEKKQVRVQPGVIRDELNQYLKPHGLFFGPNTSTSNRCMIGGMVGNNSSGTTSIKYGVTREKLVSLKTVLFDGSEVEFSSISKEEFDAKKEENTFEGLVYKSIYNLLKDKKVQDNIKAEFPKESIHRRNVGYAVDELLKSDVFGGKEQFNMGHLLSGSEGTLAFSTEITLQLDDLPPSYAAMLVPHYKTLEDCLADVAPVMEEGLYTCEMMDKIILDCTKSNREQLANRFFIEGDPAAVLMLEVRADSESELDKKIQSLEKRLENTGLSYASATLKDENINKANELRKAGLGLLGNMIGDRKAVACIEDTAVALEDLKDFIADFSKIMASYKQEAVYYAHAGAGELHLRPILNLKKGDDVKLFRSITTDVAKLTKAYNGSFSGEHGDGIVRAEFIPMLIGEENYQLLIKLKSIFDPTDIFNPGKIVEAFPMDESLRYEVDREEPKIETLMDFSDKMGILRIAEACNGSGDCRKTEKSAGGMCPSYQATKDEKDTTRARANAFREFLTNGASANKFDSKELKEVLDLCVSCKACASECPSNVDITALKAEFLYQYQKKNGFSTRSKFFAYSTALNKMMSKASWFFNTVNSNKLTGGIVKASIGIAQERSIPKVYNCNFDKHLKKLKSLYNPKGKEVVLFVDEFIRYMDVEIGKDAIELLTRLGYQVQLFYGDSGRTFLSKGFLKQAQKQAEINIDNLEDILDKNLPIIGIEPSAVLSFKDEYKRLLAPCDDRDNLGNNASTITKFLADEMSAGSISKSQFISDVAEIKLHAHCHEKSIETSKGSFDVLNFPENYKVTLINSGCCGMAGSFGYEKEHYETSMKIGSLRLFPAIEKTESSVIIAATGTSCRHQIKDGTSRDALHPVTILKNALVKTVDCCA